MSDKSLAITTSEAELEKQLMEETDVENIKNIINLFNLNIKKKDIVRTAKLNELQDKVYNQIDKRLSNKADEFSNTDLLNYYKVIQDSINKADTTLDKVDTPAIQIVQNQLNVATENKPTLSKESRQKITDIVQAFLTLSEKEQESINAEFTEVIEEPEYEQLSFSFDEENNIVQQI